MGMNEWYELLGQLNEKAVGFLTELAEDLLQQQRASQTRPAAQQQAQSQPSD